MATIEVLPCASGTRYKVKWRDRAIGAAPSVSFLDRRRADHFRVLVESHSNCWPPAQLLIAAGFDDVLDTPSAPARPITVETVTPAYENRSLVEFCKLYVQVGTKKGAGDDELRTIAAYIRNHVQPFFGTMRLVDVHLAQLRAWQKYMTDKGMTRKTIQNVRGSLLNPVMQRAMMRGENGENRLRDDNPLTGLPLPKATSTYVRPMLVDADEVEIFLAAAAKIDQQAHDLILCMIGTGVRWGEATGLPADAVQLNADLTGGVLDVWQVAAKRQGKLPHGVPRFHLRGDPKSIAGRRQVPFGARVARMFAARAATGSQLMFTHPADGLPADLWNPITFRNKYLRPIQDLAMARGLPRRVTPHGLRKTWVNNLYEERVNPISTAAAAGHTSAMVAVEHYTEATTRGHDALRAATDRLLAA